MDNKAYLDQIAVKEQTKKSNSLLSPALLKLIIGAVILIIMLVVIIVIFSGQNKTSYNSYAELYKRYNMLLDEESSPMLLQKENLHSSKLRANTANFITLAKSFRDSYASLAESVGIDINTIDATRSATIDNEFTDFSTNLNNAYMNGYLDSSYASECAYQIAVLIQLENDIYETTDNDTLKEKIGTNMNNLKTFEAIYEQYGSADENAAAQTEQNTEATE